MSLFKKMTQGIGENTEQIKLLAKKIEEYHSDIKKGFDFLEEISKLKDDKNKLADKLKLQEEDYKKMIALKDKNIKSLEDKISNDDKNNKKFVEETKKVLEDKDNIIASQQKEIEDFKSDHYLKVPVKKCIGSKQKAHLKSSAVNSRIIKKVIDNEEKN